MFKIHKRTMWTFFDRDLDMIVEWDEETKRLDIGDLGKKILHTDDIKGCIYFLKEIDKFIEENSHGKKKEKPDG